MNKIEKIKKIMDFGENFHMCDVSEIEEDHIHLESWDEDVSKSDFDLIAELIANDGYDISGFELLEIPHPKIFCFGNLETNEYFDVVKIFTDKWQFSYIKDFSNCLAHSIKEAIVKNEWGKDIEENPQTDEIMQIKQEMASLGWNIEEKISDEGWNNNIGYSIWFKRSDWHEKYTYSLTGRQVVFIGVTENALDYESVLTTVKTTAEKAKKAWTDFPDAIPCQNAKGEVVKDYMVYPFEEGKDIKKVPGERRRKFIKQQ